MKLSAFLGCLAGFVAACAAPKPPAESTTQTTSAALTAEEQPQKTAAEAWAESKVAGEKGGAGKEAGDPLAMNNEIEEASLPKIELTPAKELRGKSRGDLQAAIGLVKSASSVDGAVKKITGRLGKPTWTENGQRWIWVAKSGATCHRLVLEADGNVEVEQASASEWRMLTALARQNPCTGEIQRGMSK